MALFNYKDREGMSDLEIALQGIPETTFAIDFLKEGEINNEVKKPLYTLPVFTRNGVVYGKFVYQSGIAEAPIGFMRRGIFLTEKNEYYGLEGTTIKSISEDGRIFLPLVKIPGIKLAL